MTADFLRLKDQGELRIMKEKDLLEKVLEEYNDVYAGIRSSP